MRFIKSFHLSNLVYYAAGVAAVAYITSYFFPQLFPIGSLVLVLTGLSVVADMLIIYSVPSGLSATRVTGERFSLGDNNPVRIELENNYGFDANVSVIDELPFQFQERHWLRRVKVPAHARATIDYTLTPHSRGEYVFHDINVYVQGPLRLVRRRYVFDGQKTVKVYPSYIQMRRYQLLAVANRLQEAGIKRLRRVGHSMEFEQIREYVRGEDYRTINWKATARKDNLMVNSYTDERSQQVYCLINKGRVMKMPFNGLTLLDHAINAALVLSNVALIRQDRAGLVTFEKNIDGFLVADKKPTQMNLILEMLYRQTTDYLEPDMEKLFSLIRHRITHRGLLVMFTNFESMESLQRELPALRKIARYHLLMVVFFENTELRSLIDNPAKTLEEIYIKTIAEKFAFEKRLMVRELHKNGILSILTTPENLTVNTINKYLELKTKLSI